ncbi:MAG TPA: DUF4097 family beta strand repeat-containing protein [Gaiella sp.]|nr:DUF4097 family beta strand repeat-containing protein [Gaiella sp.]
MATFETPGPVALRINSPAGNVSVETWSEPRVEAEVTALRGDDASRQAAAETRIEAAERGGRHEIVVQVPKREGRFGFLGRSPELQVSIRCPEGADLELTNHSSDLEARGPLGDVAVKSASGDVELGDARALAFTTASGDLSAGAVAGELNAKGASGDVEVRSVGGRSSVSTVSGDVRIGAADDAIAVNTVSGDVDLEATGAEVRVTTVSGDVSVGARPGLALWIDAQSVSGSMRSDLDVGELPSAGEGERQVELRIRTVSGDVRISRSGAPAI